MTADTIFDIASLTKIVATTSAMMKLFEEGKVRMADPVTAYLPEVRRRQFPHDGPRPDDSLLRSAPGSDAGTAMVRI